MHISECVCPPHYVSVDDRSVGIERSRIFFSSRRAARPRHWKTTGSPELGNVEAVTYLVNLDNFPISQRAHCRVPSFVFSCRVYRRVRVFVATLSLSLSFVSLSYFFLFLLLDITIVFTGPAFTSSSPSYTHFNSLWLLLHSQSGPFPKKVNQLASKDSPSPLCVCSNNNLLDVFISSNLAALCTTNFLVFSVSSSPINRQGARSSINQTHPLSLSNFLSALTRFNQLCRINKCALIYNFPELYVKHPWYIHVHL